MKSFVEEKQQHCFPFVALRYIIHHYSYVFNAQTLIEVTYNGTGHELLIAMSELG